MADRPIGYVNGVPVFAGGGVILRSDGAPIEVPPKRGRPELEDRYVRPDHLDKLVLAPRQAQVVTDLTFRPPSERPRLAAAGMNVELREPAAVREIPPIEALPGPVYVRSLPERPAQTAYQINNWPFLYPEHYVTQTDLDDYDLGTYGQLPLVSEVIDALVAARVRLSAPSPEREEDLTPFGRLFLRSLRATAEGFALPFDSASDLELLKRPRDGLLHRTLGGILERASAFGVVSEQSMQRTYGAAGVELYRAIHAAVPARRGLQYVLSRARFPMEPTYAHIAPTREEIAATRARDPAQLELMVQHAGLPEHLPMIDAAAEQIPDGAFADVHMVAVQHVLGSQVAMFGAMERKGLDPRRAKIIGVPYSTSYVTEHALRKRGYDVDTPEITDPNDVSPAVDRAIDAALQDVIARSAADGRPILVLDDGGKVSRAVHERFAEHAHRFRIVEQTTRGITELAALPQIRTRVVDVASSVLKKYESETIGAEVVRNVEALLSRIGMDSMEGREVTVVGYGTIGRGTAEMLRRLGAKVTIHDKDPAKLIEAAAAGFAAAATKAEAFADKHVIIGATGHRSITREDVERYMSHETVLASASSRDVEIDLSVNRDRDVEVVPLLAEGPGDRRFTTRVWRFAEKDIVVLRNGFPVNFNGALETTSYESIQQTRAIMLLGAAQALREALPGVDPLSLKMQRVLAARCGLPPIDR